MQKMQGFKYLLDKTSWKLLRLPMQTLSRYGKKDKRGSKSVGKEHSELEARDRRRRARQGIKTYLRGIWDASEDTKRMEGILQSKTRIDQTEKIQQEAERKKEANTKVSGLAKHPGYEVLKGILIMIEGDAYYKMRNIQTRNEKDSVEYWIGKQEGRLSVIEDIRSLVQTSVLERHMEELKEKKINEQTKK